MGVPGLAAYGCALLPTCAVTLPPAHDRPTARHVRLALRRPVVAPRPAPGVPRLIDLALGAIVRQLNESLRRTFGVREDMAVLSSLVEPDGSVGTQSQNRLVVSLVNVERETLAQREPRPPRNPLGPSVVSAEPVHLVLTVLFAASFDGAHYDEALKLLSATVGFFQSRPVLDPHNTPELDRRIDRLALDMVNLGFAELSNLWSIVGGKYQPSVLYRVRMVSVDLAQISGLSRPALAPDTGVGR